jgi:hypothetical protein
LPGAIPRSDEAESVGAGRIAENIGVIGRINSGQTARDHIATLAIPTVAIPSSHSRSGAENAQGGADRKYDESLVSNHGDLPPIPVNAGPFPLYGDANITRGCEVEYIFVRSDVIHGIV